MSGGSHNYIYGSLGVALDIPSGGYGLGREDGGRYGTYWRDSKAARAIDPMEDKDLSEMMYDVSCLLHSLEWYQSGDTGEEQYAADKKYFKEKWFGRAGSDGQKKAYLDDLRDEIHRMTNIVDKFGYRED